MHLSKTIWACFFLFFLLVMVSCEAPGCSWARKTDIRGLTRHRIACPFYKRFSTLASQKRQDRAKGAALSNLIPNPVANASESFKLVGDFWRLFQVQTNFVLSFSENLSSPACEGPSEFETHCSLQAPQGDFYVTWAILCLQPSCRLSAPP
jgi:hypothetical protein